ncbi:hypothetical protein [Symbioplanes lichenis]|uniref:hypothetical protein n=1 Tax=Symbioplanes lichenis TaxID=1629072 RepID=UPI002738592C|nr:hypothetical protein [Actinoplanes lichenis]
MLGDPFQAVAPDRLFFPEQGGKLWSRLNRAELTIGQTYRVKASKQDYPLDVGPFGLGYRSEQTERTLIASRVRLGGGEQEMSCSGQPDVPAPPKKAAEYRTLPSDKVPEPEPSPSLTGSGDPTASPSVLDASASVPPETAATDPTVPAAPVDDLLSVGPDRTPA